MRESAALASARHAGGGRADTHREAFALHPRCYFSRRAARDDERRCTAPAQCSSQGTRFHCSNQYIKVSARAYRNDGSTKPICILESTVARARTSCAVNAPPMTVAAA